jgi:hypothetical protein
LKVEAEADLSSTLRPVIMKGKEWGNIEGRMMKRKLVDD